jgi:signal transduction histidine kinase
VSARLALTNTGTRDDTAPPQLLVRIADQGPGMTAEECALATERFWRKSSALHGSGLSLTIVQRIAERAGGCLQLRPGTAQAPGLVAELRLPLRLAAGARDMSTLTQAALLTKS